MKFKAKIVDLDLFQRIVYSVEKVGKTLILHLTKSKVHLVVVNETMDDVAVWGAFEVASVFSDYRISSQTDGEISMKLKMHSLLGLLRGKFGEIPNDTIMNVSLRKKNDMIPILSFTIDMFHNESLVITHELPVTLLSHSFIQQYAEPKLPPPQVELYLPSVKTMQRVVGKLKNVAQFAVVTATSTGELGIEVKSPNSTINVHFDKVRISHPAIPVEEAMEVADSSDTVTAQGSVSITHFLKALNCYPILPRAVIFCIVPENAFVINAVTNDVYLTYYVHIRESDE